MLVICAVYRGAINDTATVEHWPSVSSKLCNKSIEMTKEKVLDRVSILSLHFLRIRNVRIKYLHCLELFLNKLCKNENTNANSNFNVIITSNTCNNLNHIN